MAPERSLVLPTFGALAVAGLPMHTAEAPGGEDRDPGPVGQRAALMLAREGARVAITGRVAERTQAAAKAVSERAGVAVEAIFLDLFAPAARVADAIPAADLRRVVAGRGGRRA